MAQSELLSTTSVIVNVLTGTASLVQECRITVYVKAVCSSCEKLYWALVEDKHEYLKLYPHCSNCGVAMSLDDLSQDDEVIGCQTTLLQKGNRATASFKLTRKACDEPNIKRTIQQCDIGFLH